MTNNKNSISQTYIERMRVRNIGLFNALDVKFNNRFNFIVGPNGSGKTTILKYIALCLNPSGNAIREFRYRENAEICLDFCLESHRYRLGLGKGWVSKGKEYRSAKKIKDVKPNRSYGPFRFLTDKSSSSKVHYPNLTESRLLTPRRMKEIQFSPLFIGAYRKIDYEKISLRSEEYAEDQRIYYIRQSMKRLLGTHLPNVKQWLVNRDYEIKKAWGDIERENWNYFCENTKHIGPPNSNLRFIDIDRGYEPKFSVFETECYLEELSAGFQAVISVIIEIFAWVERTHEKKEERLVKNARGTVIIDEIDIHLHPEWQLSIRNTLEKMFPKLQFIITTHSPHIVATAKENEILFIEETREGKIPLDLELIPDERAYSGWSMEYILKELMGVENLETIRYIELLTEAMNYKKEKKIKELAIVMETLRKISHPNDSVIKALDLDLTRLEVEKEE